MAKSSGLGDYFWFSGNDLSGDTNSLQKVSGSVALLDFTGINNLAFVRQAGQRQGMIQWTSYWNSTGAHPVLSALPTTDQLGTYVTNLGSASSAIGNPAFCMQGLQLNYDPTRTTAGALTMSVTANSDAYGGEWGYLLTPGIRTDTAATNGASFDAGGGLVTPAVPASGTPATNTSGVPVTVVISGGTVTNVVVNGVSVGTGDGTYNLPPGSTIAVTYSAAPTWTWTISTAFGAQAYLHAFSFTGTDVTVTIQDSADNSTFANVASFAFTQITGGTPSWQRIAIANNATLRRYVRAITTTTGGFTNLQFAVVLVRNLIAGQVF